MNVSTLQAFTPARAPEANLDVRPLSPKTCLWWIFIASVRFVHSFPSAFSCQWLECLSITPPVAGYPVTPKLSPSQRTQTPGRDHASHALKIEELMDHPFKTVKAKWQVIHRATGCLQIQTNLQNPESWIPPSEPPSWMSQWLRTPLYSNLDANKKDDFCFFENISRANMFQHRHFGQSYYPTRPRLIIWIISILISASLRPHNYIPSGCVSSSSITTMPTKPMVPTIPTRFRNFKFFGASSAHLKTKTGCCSMPRVVGGKALDA